MSIHSSFTKKDLCKIIEKFNLNINVNLNRNNICKEILNYVEEYNLESIGKFYRSYVFLKRGNQ